MHQWHWGSRAGGAGHQHSASVPEIGPAGLLREWLPASPRTPRRADLHSLKLPFLPLGAKDQMVTLPGNSRC